MSLKVNDLENRDEVEQVLLSASWFWKIICFQDWKAV